MAAPLFPSIIRVALGESSEGRHNDGDANDIRDTTAKEQPQSAGEVPSSEAITRSSANSAKKDSGELGSGLHPLKVTQYTDPINPMKLDPIYPMVTNRSPMQLVSKRITNINSNFPISVSSPFETKISPHAGIVDTSTISERSRPHL
jgi:hypothetical protein